MSQQPKRLSGEQAEQWFREFTQKAGIEDRTTYSLVAVVSLLDQKLQWRLSQARLNAFQEFPDGPEWIDRITQNRALPLIRHDVRQDFVKFLLDRVVAIDASLRVKNSDGMEVAIAVDVTTNATKEAEKLRKIRGHPGDEDGRNANNNRNIPEVRAALGYDKHMVLILNSDPQNLPSYEKLIDSIYRFAESKSRTRVSDLRELEPHERYSWRRALESDPDQMWQKYSAGLNPRDKTQFTYQVVARALRAEHSDQSIKAMLTRDPQYKKLERGPTEIAENYANLMLRNVKLKLAAPRTKRQQRDQDIDRGPSLGM